MHPVSTARWSRICSGSLGVPPRSTLSTVVHLGSPPLDDMGICAQLTILSGSRDPVQSLHTCGLSSGRVPAYRPHSPYLHTHPRTRSLVIVSIMSHVCTLVTGRTVGDDAPHFCHRKPAVSPNQWNTLHGGPNVPSGSQPTVTLVTPSPDMLLSSNQLANLLPWSVPSLHVDRSGGSYVREGLPPAPQKLADRIRRREFIDMAEMLAEFWPIDHKGQGGRGEEAQSLQAKASHRLSHLAAVFCKSTAASWAVRIPAGSRS